MGPCAVPPFEYVPGQPVPTTNTDFDVGWWPPGTWLNYTRTFPTNTYEIYGRLANGGAYSNATMSFGDCRAHDIQSDDPDAGYVL